MNPIEKALSEVKFRIPPQIVNEIFSRRTLNWRIPNISIDEQIRNSVIRARVLVDCNLVGGTEAMIPLDTVPVEQIDTFTNIYRIPKSLTNGRTIMSALSVSYSSVSLQGIAGGLGGVRPQSVTPISMAGMAMMDSNSPTPLASSAKVQLIAENTIMVRDINPLISTGYLRCILENDENLSHIQARSILQFCDLVVLAVKAFIYNEYIITLDQAQLSGGQELGRFKEIIEGYSDTDEMYREYLAKTWSGVAFMNDRETMNRFIKLQIGAMR